MRKKISTILIVVAMVFAFVSCSNETADPRSLVMVQFDSRNNTRGLSITDSVFDPSDYYWYYEAFKNDDNGMTTGATEGLTSVKPYRGINTEVGPFSQGNWIFKLYAFDDSEKTRLLYYGETEATLIASDVPTQIKVKVMNSSTGDGFLTVKKSIGVVDVNGNSATNCVRKIEIASVADADNFTELNTPVSSSSTADTYKIKSGKYRLKISVLDGDIVIASNSIFFTVYDNFEVIVGGTLDEITQSGEFVPEFDGASDVASPKAPIKGAEGGTLSASSAIGKTDVVIPAGAIDVDGDAVLGVTNYDTIGANGKFKVEPGDTRAVITALDLKLSVGTTEITKFNKPITVSAFIGKGLNPTNAPDKISVVYAGDSALSQPTDVVYDNDTGILSFKTDHFSEYYILADGFEAWNSGTNEFFNSLDDALASVASTSELLNQKIYLLKDITRTDRIYIDFDVTINLNGHSITDVRSSKGGENFVVGNNELTLEGTGKLIGNGNNSLICVLGTGSNRGIINLVGDIDYIQPKANEGSVYIAKSYKGGVLNISAGNFESPSNLIYTFGNTSGMYRGSETHVTGGTFTTSGTSAAFITHGTDKTQTAVTVKNAVINGIAMYNPGATHVEFKDCLIVSPYTAIYSKVGDLVVESCDITITKSDNAFITNGNGSSLTGSAIVVQAMGYRADEPKYMSVPSFKGYYNNIVVQNSNEPEVMNYPLLIVNTTMTKGSVKDNGYVAGDRFAVDVSAITHMCYEVVEVDDTNKVMLNNKVVHSVYNSQSSSSCDSSWYDSAKDVMNINNASQYRHMLYNMDDYDFTGKTININIDMDYNGKNAALPLDNFNGTIKGNNHTFTNIKKAKEPSELSAKDLIFGAYSSKITDITCEFTK